LAIGVAIIDKAKVFGLNQIEGKLPYFVVHQCSANGEIGFNVKVVGNFLQGNSEGIFFGLIGILDKKFNVSHASSIFKKELKIAKKKNFC